MKRERAELSRLETTRGGGGGGGGGVQCLNTDRLLRSTEIENRLDYAVDSHRWRAVSDSL